MAVIYYPTDAGYLTRSVSGSNYTEIFISVHPDSIFFFNDQGFLTSSYGSASFSYTASYVAIGRSVVLCSAFTPSSTGADAAEVTIPFSPIDSTSSLSWNIKRLSLRTQTAESVTSSVNIEKTTSTGSFSAISIGTITLFSGSYEAVTTGSLGTILSGNKIRFNVATLGTATNWTIITEISNA